LGARADARSVTGKPGGLAGKRELPGGQHNDERRGQDAEKLDRGLPEFSLPAFALPAPRSVCPRPCHARKVGVTVSRFTTPTSRKRAEKDQTLVAAVSRGR
jgi:hypothetical protein